MILGAFAFLLVIHYLAFVLTGADWIGGLFVLPQLCGYLFLFMMGAGCLLRTAFLLYDRPFLEADQMETQPKNGRRIAVNGTIQSIETHLFSPTSSNPCVMYEYQIFREMEKGDHPEAVGWAFVPSSVKTDKGTFDLLDYPKLMNFPERELSGTFPSSQLFIKQTRFKKIKGILAALLPDVVGLFPSLSWLLFLNRPASDKTGEIRADIDYTGKRGKFRADKMTTRVVFPGTSVIALGKYSSKKKGLISGWIGLRLINAESGIKGIRKLFNEDILAYSIGSVLCIGLWLLAAHLSDILSLYVDVYSTLSRSSITEIITHTSSAGKPSISVAPHESAISNVAEFITVWYTSGIPPVPVFPFESITYQSIALLCAIIFPMVSLIIQFIYGNKTQGISLAALTYLALFMVLDAGIFLNYGTTEQIDRSLYNDLFPVLKIALPFFLFASSVLPAFTFAHRIFVKKKLTMYNFLTFSICSFLCIGFSVILINSIKADLYRNDKERATVKGDGPTIINQQSNRKVKTFTSEQQLRSRDDIKAMLKQYNFYDIDLNPSGNFENDFKDNGDGTITDRATGLMWERSGSEKLIRHDKLKSYVDELNRKQHLGYSDWILPHVDELASLLEPAEKGSIKPDPSVGLFIHPLFDRSQSWCWTADKLSSKEAWVVYFYSGCVGGYPVVHGMDGFSCYVRVVRHGHGVKKNIWKRTQKSE